MSIISRGFHGRRGGDVRLPPGQYLERGYPVLSAGPTPRVSTDTWQFTITTETGDTAGQWNWQQLMALPQVDVTTDIHCVTKWSKLDTHWRGVSLDTLLDGIDTKAGYVMARSYGGYTTNLPLPDIRDGKAWVVYEYEGEPLPAEHGGPIRMLVPHLYFWKSAKWVNGLTLMLHDKQGFWEQLGYNDYGDPWREQRYQGD
ncbi:MAG TPA: sulfite oxidase-like oxidoreductase [Trebonia sp.]|nr:sulfite oxidase-like oxidoreductase [Trebonia sp.]